MALFNLFRRKRKEQKIKIEQQEKISKAKEELKEKLKKTEKVSEVQEDKVLTKIYPASKVLKEPHITEKATRLIEGNQYVFKVYPKVNKFEVKKAIEALYKVKVEDVRMINIPRKRKRLGRFEGWRKGYKKAIVKLAPGHHIEILPK